MSTLMLMLLSRLNAAGMPAPGGGRSPLCRRWTRSHPAGSHVLRGVTDGPTVGPHRAPEVNLSGGGAHGRHGCSAGQDRVIVSAAAGRGATAGPAAGGGRTRGAEGNRRRSVRRVGTCGRRRAQASGAPARSTGSPRPDPPLSASAVPQQTGAPPSVHPSPGTVRCHPGWNWRRSRSSPLPSGSRSTKRRSARIRSTRSISRCNSSTPASAVPSIRTCSVSRPS
jgi:hypothetical protein